jgi:hypothetical protein
MNRPATASPAERRQRVPDARLPVWYLVFAHLCLITAFLAFALIPRSLAGFYYHPRLIAVVHLVTLGWITASILGALYLLLPLAMRAPLPASRVDRWAFWSFAIGAHGIISHFWIEELSGMVWSALLVVAALAWVGWRVLSALGKSQLPLAHRLPFHLAFGNMLLAALVGIAIGIDRNNPILPGFVLNHVAAHAHLAALGWATFMVMGASYRLLPMMLPAAVPTGRRLLISTIACEVGLLTLSVGLFFGSRLAIPGGALYALGLILFFDRIRWMLGNRRPPPKDLARPDFGVLQVAFSFLSLILAGTLGSVILLTSDKQLATNLLMPYGVLLLVGFLAQMVAGVSIRILPLFAWMRDFSTADFEQLPPSPHELGSRKVRAAGFALWATGLPLLVLGLARDWTPCLSIAGATLAAAVTLSLVQLWLLVKPHPMTPVERRPGSTG